MPCGRLRPPPWASPSNQNNARLTGVGNHPERIENQMGGGVHRRPWIMDDSNYDLGFASWFYTDTYTGPAKAEYPAPL